MSLYKLLHTNLCPIVNMKKVAHQKIFIHNSTINSLNNHKITNLILKKRNKCMHMFTEMKIEYDINDMFVKYYKIAYSFKELPKIAEVYNKYVSIFPNYCTIETGDIMVKNIKMKKYVNDNAYESFVNVGKNSIEDVNKLVITNMINETEVKQHPLLNLKYNGLENENDLKCSIVKNNKNDLIIENNDEQSIYEIENFIDVIENSIPLHVKLNDRLKKEQKILQKKLKLQQKEGNNLIHTINSQSDLNKENYYDKDVFVYDEIQNGKRTKIVSTSKNIFKNKLDKFLGEFREKRFLHSNSNKFLPTYKFLMKRKEMDKDKINFSKEEFILRNGMFLKANKLSKGNNLYKTIDKNCFCKGNSYYNSVIKKQKQKFTIHKSMSLPKLNTKSINKMKN